MQIVRSGIVQLSAVSYWAVGTGAAQKGMTVPSIWQPPQITQLAAGIWPNCGDWWKGIQGGVKRGGVRSGGETAGGRHEPCGRGWVDGALAPVGKLLSVKLVEPLDETSFPGQLSSTFSSFTVCSTISSSSCLFSIFLVFSSCIYQTQVSLVRSMGLVLCHYTFVQT